MNLKYSIRQKPEVSDEQRTLPPSPKSVYTQGTPEQIQGAILRASYFSKRQLQREVLGE